MAAACAGSRMRPQPALCFAIFGTGHPMLMSTMSAPASTTRAASAMRAGSPPKIWIATGRSSSVNSRTRACGRCRARAPRSDTISGRRGRRRRAASRAGGTPSRSGPPWGRGPSGGASTPGLGIRDSGLRDSGLGVRELGAWDSGPGGWGLEAGGWGGHDVALSSCCFWLAAAALSTSLPSTCSGSPAVRQAHRALSASKGEQRRGAQAVEAAASILPSGFPPSPSGLPAGFGEAGFLVPPHIGGVERDGHARRRSW